VELLNVCVPVAELQVAGELKRLPGEASRVAAVRVLVAVRPLSSVTT
jgi:hypothetical protein